MSASKQATNFHSPRIECSRIYTPCSVPALPCTRCRASLLGYVGKMPLSSCSSCEDLSPHHPRRQCSEAFPSIFRTDREIAHRDWFTSDYTHHQAFLVGVHTAKPGCDNAYRDSGLRPDVPRFHHRRFLSISRRPSGIPRGRLVATWPCDRGRPEAAPTSSEMRIRSGAPNLALAVSSPSIDRDGPFGGGGAAAWRRTLWNAFAAFAILGRRSSHASGSTVVDCRDLDAGAVPSRPNSIAPGAMIDDFASFQGRRI